VLSGIDHSTRASGKARPRTQPYVQAANSKGDDGGGCRTHADHDGGWGGVRRTASELVKWAGGGRKVRNGGAREKVVIQKCGGGMPWMLRRPPPVAIGPTLALREDEAP